MCEFCNKAIDQAGNNLDLASKTIDDAKIMIKTMKKLEKEKHLLKCIVKIINRELSSNNTISYKTKIKELDGMTVSDVLGTVVEVKEKPIQKPSNVPMSRILDFS